MIKENDKYLPKLIELQAFPSILSSCFFYLDYYNKYNLLPDFKVNDKSEKKILELYKKTILGKEKKKHVIMLDYKQNTSSTHFDFQFTEKLLGIKSVCIENIISIDNEFFYIRKNKLTKIKRIYNRIILENIPDKKKSKFINLFKNKKIHWVGHPDWYYHVSKNVLESLEGESILKCYSLDNIKNKEIFNQEFVIKPKFDYGGNNVFLNPILKDIENIKNKSDFIIQEKINYERIIHSFNRKLYTEFRLLFIFNEENLEALSKYASKGLFLANKNQDIIFQFINSPGNNEAFYWFYVKLVNIIFLNNENSFVLFSYVILFVLIACLGRIIDENKFVIIILGILFANFFVITNVYQVWRHTMAYFIFFILGHILRYMYI